MADTESLMTALWFGLDNDDEARAQAALSRAAILARQGGLKPLPRSVQQIVEVLKNPNFQMVSLERALSADPGLTTRVLQLANSVGFGGRTGVVSVREAVVRLGVKNLQELVVEVALRKMFRDAEGAARIVVNHGAQVANLVRAMGTAGFRAPDGTALCGMLQDVGKLLLIQSGEFQYGADGPLCGFDSTAAQEREALGFDHALVGAVAATTWEIPEPVPQVIAWHHQLLRATDNDPVLGRMVAFLGVAEKLLYARLQGELLAEEVEEQLIADPSFVYAGIGSDELQNLWDLFLDPSLLSTDVNDGDNRPSTSSRPRGARPKWSR